MKPEEFITYTGLICVHFVPQGTSRLEFPKARVTVPETAAVAASVAVAAQKGASAE